MKATARTLLQTENLEGLSTEPQMRPNTGLDSAGGCGPDPKTDGSATRFGVVLHTAVLGGGSGCPLSVRRFYI